MKSAIILFNPKKNKQNYIINTSKNAITSLDFSRDGAYLVTGEYGQSPHIRIWDVKQQIQVAEFDGHKHGISCVAFCPNQKYIISVSSQHDMIVSVWDWRNALKTASNKLSSKVKAISFAENGNYFVTVGNRHVKFWYLDVSRPSKYKEIVPLTGRSAILGEQRNNYFCDVGCGRGEMGDSTFVITRSGLLCEFNNRRLLNRWVELRTVRAYCLAVGRRHIFIGCASGIIRCFNPFNLQFITTLPRTHYLGVDVSKALNIKHMAESPVSGKYPSVVALVLDEESNKITSVYDDHSLYVWDIHDVKKVGKSHSYMYHASCVWDIEVISDESSSSFPSGTFITCSSDDTIRIWNLETNVQMNDLIFRNIYSDELLKILYFDSLLSNLCDVQNKSGSSDKLDAACDTKYGIRCIRLSPEGKHLASGDRCGNIRVHELSCLEELCYIEAHDAEVLCLNYSPINSFSYLMASGSRDRLIHIFDVAKKYAFLYTLADHTLSVTAVHFFIQDLEMYLVSCAANKSLIFWRIEKQKSESNINFTRVHQVIGKSTFYDMQVHNIQQNVITACQDRHVRIYKLGHNKCIRAFRGSQGDEGTLIKLSIDSSLLYLVTSCTDKNLYIYHYESGECLAVLYGHSELITAIRFSYDCRHLISASGDGCIFIWRLPLSFTHTVQASISRKFVNNSETSVENINPSLDQYITSQDDKSFQFPSGPLPLWAKKQIIENGNHISHTEKQVDFPKGRWAQRIDSTGITVKSIYDSDSVIPFPLGNDAKKLMDNSSKESSLDSILDSHQVLDVEGTEEEVTTDFQASLSPFIMKDGHIILRKGHQGGQEFRPKQFTDDSSIGSLRLEEIETEHDGDIDDFSEQESSGADLAEHLIFCPHVEETENNFIVNAADHNELIKSLKGTKKFKANRLHLDASPTLSLKAQDSDEVSTPSGEGIEKSNFFSRTVSIDNLTRVQEREHYLKSSFEFMEPSQLNSSNKNILDSVPIRNAPVISALLQTRQNPDSLQKRAELQQRIQESKKKLQNIGARSLRMSCSINDLTHFSDVNSCYSESVGASGSNLRRACSLSDLSDFNIPSWMHAPPSLYVSGKMHEPIRNKTHLNSQTLHLSQKSDSNDYYLKAKKHSSAFHSISVDDLTWQGNYSSSEERSSPEQHLSQYKGRSLIPHHYSAKNFCTASERDLTNIENVFYKHRHYDLNASPLDYQLLDAVGNSLLQASNNVVKLYQRLNSNHHISDRHRKELLESLHSNVLRSYKCLSPLFPEESPVLLQLMEQYSEKLVGLIKKRIVLPS